MQNFWQEIKKPIFSLAPMEDVTDTVFREIVMEISDPEYLQVLFAEFTSTDGLCHPVGKEKVSHRLFSNPSEVELRKKLGIKLVAQIWGGTPEKFAKATKMICEEFDFDGIDINMGCPVKKIVKQAACSELIKHPDLARDIILATQEASDIPVSVKTRTGISVHNTEDWVSNILTTKPAALTLHGRTQKMMPKSPANWDEIAKASALVKEMSPDTIMIGNGDVESVEDALEKVEKYGVDGVMIGRGIFTNPWFYNKRHVYTSRRQKLKLLLKHTKLYAETWSDEKSFAILKRFFKIYTANFPGASELRNELMQAKTVKDVEKILEK
jgi:nifR3 family TIM-barrel protein